MSTPGALLHSGKVRDVYDAGDDRLVLVASDRLSAFDVVMAEPVPDKGRVLTAMSAYWAEELADVAPTHLISTDLGDLPPALRRSEWAGRVMLCRRAEMLPIECIVRGYLSGSAWREYRRKGTVHGEPVEPGLVEADRLAEPRFTPSTKSTTGHDENISSAAATELVGAEVFEAARTMCLALYERAVERAGAAGIVIADTKFELGFVDERLVVADEMLTPDSSRFWPASEWHPGSTPPSFDKQPVRDHLDALDWDKTPPPPPLGAEVVEATRRRYVEAYERITGRSLADWPGGSDT